MDATSKVIVVSGGSKGLGRRVAERCLTAGYRVATFSRTESDFIVQQRAAANSEGRFFWQKVDAMACRELEGFVAETILRFGRIDVVINNAGVGMSGLLTLTRPAEIATVLSVNLHAAINLSQLCTKAMLRQRSGCILNISSVNGLRGHSGVSVYSAAKAGLDGFTRALARELGGSNIRVNSVAPGYFDSDMVGDLSEEQRAVIRRRTPLKTLATMDDIVNCLMFLWSDSAKCITGQTVVVDGGLTC